MKADLGQSATLQLVLFFAFCAAFGLVVLTMLMFDHRRQVRHQRWLRRQRSEKIVRHRLFWGGFRREHW